MSELLVERQDDTWTFTLHRPDKLNALSAGLVDELLHAVDVAHAQQARLLVFRGAGRSFCAGFDLSDLEAQSEGDLVLRFVRIEMLLQAVATSPCQTLALAQGKVFGAGVDLFAVCRQRVAAADASFRMPGLKFGLVLGTRRFGEIVGRERALAILQETRPFTAEQARELGFVQRLLPPDEWPDLVAATQAQVAQLDDATRAALYRVLHEDQADADLAMLTCSAARFGLKDRLRKYLGK